MKFKIDENLPVEIADLLKRAGYDALTVSDQNLSGITDPEIISICNSEERALISFDLGFANIQAYPPENLPGLIVVRLKSQDKRHVPEVFSQFISTLLDEPVAGNLWIVEENRIRIWK